MLWTIAALSIALAIVVLSRIAGVAHARPRGLSVVATLGLSLPREAHYVNLVVVNRSLTALEEVSWPSNRAVTLYRPSVGNAIWSAFSHLALPSESTDLVGWRLGSDFLTLIPHGQLITLLVATSVTGSVRVSDWQGAGLSPVHTLVDGTQALRSYRIRLPVLVTLRINGTAIYDLKIFSTPSPLPVGIPRVVGTFPAWQQGPPNAGPFAVSTGSLGAHAAVMAVLPAGLLVEIPHTVGVLTWGGRFVPLLQGPGTFPIGTGWSIVVGSGPWALVQGATQSGAVSTQESRRWWWWNIATGSFLSAALGNAADPVQTAGSAFGLSGGLQPGVYENGRRVLLWPAGFSGVPTLTGQLIGWWHGTFGIYSNGGFQPIALAPINGHALTSTVFWTVAWLPVWGPTLVVQPAGHQPWPTWHAHLVPLREEYPATTVSPPLVPWTLPFLVHATTTIQIGWPNALGQLQWHDVGALANPPMPEFGVSWDGVWWQAPHGLEAWLYPGAE
jgi:hypothetical protein